MLWKLLRVLRLMRHLAHSIGGFYFRSFEGEEAAGACWDHFFFQTRDRLEHKDLARALEALDPQESFASFSDKLAGKSSDVSLQTLARAFFDSPPQEVARALRQLDAKLRSWAGEERGLQRNLPLLELLGVILRYEMNRPYEIWYGARARLDREKFWIALERLEPRLKTIQESLQTYLETAGQREI